MTERDLNRGSGFNPGSTYNPGGNPIRETSPASSPAAGSDTPAPSGDMQSGSGLKDKVEQDWQSAKSAAQAELTHAGQRAKEAAAEQKNYAADRVGGLASAIEKVGSELEQGDQREVGRYARQIGSTIQGFADDIKGKDMGEIARMAGDFGRRQPAAFLGIAALAGFAASRFLTASAEQRATATTGTGLRTDDGPSTSAPLGSTPTASTAASPVSPATGAGYATGYSPEGSRNG